MIQTAEPSTKSPSFPEFAEEEAVQQLCDNEKKRKSRMPVGKTWGSWYWPAGHEFFWVVATRTCFIFMPIWGNHPYNGKLRSLQPVFFSLLRWWQLKYVLYSSLFGEMIQIDEHIFFRWVGEKPPTSCICWVFGKTATLRYSRSGVWVARDDVI